MVVVHTIYDEMSCAGSTAPSSHIETDYDDNFTDPLEDIITTLRQSLNDQNMRMMRLEQHNSKTTARLLEAVTSLTQELSEMKLKNKSSPYKNRDISPLNPYSKQQTPETPLTRRDPLFVQGQQHKSGWIHKFYEGMSVVIMPERLKGKVVRETAKSCYVQIGRELKPRLKRKYNVEEDLDA